MRLEPGFLKDLRDDLTSIKPEVRARLRRPGALTEEQLLTLVSGGGQDTQVSDVDHAQAIDVVNYDSLVSWQSGCDAVRAGEVAFVVLAGGAGTRAGGPKAFMRLPKLGITLTANKLMQSGFVTHEGEVIQAPTWFMTSPFFFVEMALALGGLSPRMVGCVFEQFESYRLRVDNRIEFTEPGVPELYPTGHGDVGPALIESGVLADNSNVKYVVIVNCDNVLASLDPIVLSHHIETGTQVTCELVQRIRGDRGGIPVWVENRLQVIEDFRLPEGFADESPYHNTNTLIVNVEALKQNMPWRWNRVRKQVGTRIVVQHERLVQQYTEVFDTRYVVVDRNRRYLPVKFEGDLFRADEVLNGNRRT